MTPEEQACYDRLRAENAELAKDRTHWMEESQRLAEQRNALLKRVSEYERDFVATCSLHAHAGLLTDNAALREAAQRVVDAALSRSSRNVRYTVADLAKLLERP
jgi:hypothetical protein